MKTPVPTTAQLVQEYDAFYKDNPLRWDDFEKDDYAWSLISLYLKATKRKQPGTILDIGCGSGHTIAHFSNRWISTRFYGLDLSQEVVSFAQTRVPHACFLVGSLGETEFHEQFDAVTILGVLEHFENPVNALTEIRKLLLQGGVVYVEVPNCISYPESEKFEGFRRLKGGSQQWEWHLYRESWENLIRESGFSISLSLKGPKPWVEFIWILTNDHETISLPWKARIQFFEKKHLFRQKMPTLHIRSALLATRWWLMGHVRRIVGDSLVDKAKSLLLKKISR